MLSILMLGGYLWIPAPSRRVALKLGSMMKWAPQIIRTDTIRRKRSSLALERSCIAWSLNGLSVALRLDLSHIDSSIRNELQRTIPGSVLTVLVLAWRCVRRVPAQLLLSIKSTKRDVTRSSSHWAREYDPDRECDIRRIQRKLRLHRHENHDRDDSRGGLHGNISLRK